MASLSLCWAVQDVPAVAAQVEVVAPDDRAARAELHGREERMVLPGGEHPVAGHVRQVHLALNPVVVAEPDPVRLQRRAPRRDVAISRWGAREQTYLGRPARAAAALWWCLGGFVGDFGQLV